MIVRLRQTGQMDAHARAETLAVEGRRILEVSIDLDAAVPSCPGWFARDLLGHVAGAWQVFAAIIDAGSTEPPDFSVFAGAPDDDDGALRTFGETQLDAIVAAVAGADPNQAVWSWNATTTMRFYQRRVFHESVIHRVDAELAADDRSPVDGAVGIDGIDELFTELVATPETPPSGSFHLHQTDGDGELMLEIADGTVVVRHEHAKGDAALRASGEDLLLTMWGRRSVEGLELFGDRAVADEWIALAP
jgi:uncharacterized protein (TIGR03083 family)